jgi:hypothetical protein
VLENMQMGPRLAGAGRSFEGAAQEMGDAHKESVPVIDIDKEEIKPEDLPF